ARDSRQRCSPRMALERRAELDAVLLASSGGDLCFLFRPACRRVAAYCRRIGLGGLSICGRRCVESDVGTRVAQSGPRRFPCLSRAGQCAIPGESVGQLPIRQRARVPDGAAVRHLLQLACAGAGMAAIAHCPVGYVGAGGERNVLCRDVIAHAQPRDHVALAAISDIDPGSTRNGGGNHSGFNRRELRSFLHRVASHLRCGVYYCLSGTFLDNFARGMKRLFPILSIVTVVLLAYALYEALVVAPTDAMQGDVYRIIYYHVPSAWTAFLLFFINFVASIQYLASAKPSTRTAAKWIVIAIGVAGVIATFIPAVQAMIPKGMRPSAVATTVVLIPIFYLLIGKWFPGQKL